MPKPAFDQSKPFEKVAQVKPEFDPSKPFDTAKDFKPNVIDVGGAATAFRNSIANVATIGYLPQISAALEPAIAKGYGLIYGDEALKNYPKSTGTERRDYASARLAKEKKEHPIPVGAGMVVGSLGTGGLLSKILPAINATSKLGKIGQAAKSGAILGAATNPGDTAGEINPIQLDQRIVNAGAGALLGGTLQGSADAGSGIANWLKTKAAQKATRALGRPTPTVAQKMANTGQDKELGRTLLDEGAIPILGTPKRIEGRVEALREKAGQDVGNLIKAAGDKKVIDTEALAVEFLDSPAIQSLRTTPGMESMVAKSEQMAETMAKSKMLSLEQAQSLRQQIDKSINFAKKSDDLRGSMGLLYDLRTSLRDKMDDAIAALNIAEKGALKSTNKKYSQLSQAHEIIDKEMGRQQANRSLSLTDNIWGAAGASTGNPYAALGLAALNKAGRTFGNSLQARGYDFAANAGRGLTDTANKNQAALRALMTRGLIAPSAEDFTLGPSQPPMLIDVNTKSQRSPAKKESAIQRRLKERQQ